MQRITTVDALRDRVRTARSAGQRVGLVPTMGALHEGHLTLVREADAASDLVVVSIFVNPTQFGPGEDLDAYPRDLVGDERALASLQEAAPDVVFAPAVDEVYRGPGLTTVRVRGLTGVLCGASRPGHFDGVATVVTKLLHLVEPDVAFFGRKDYQQLTVIRTVVADLDLPVRIVGVPTVREPDGVAMSSRNAYLDAEQRVAARALSQGLRAAVLEARDARARGDHPDARMLADAAGVTLQAAPGIRVDYLQVLDADRLTPLDPPPTDAPRAADGADGHGNGTGRAAPRLLVAVAAHVGPARLIDNVVIGDPDDEQRLLDATA